MLATPHVTEVQNETLSILFLENIELVYEHLKKEIDSALDGHHEFIIR